ncbi:MAG: CbtB-domain containing protein [Candidatus Methanoperedens sp.]
MTEMSSEYRYVYEYRYELDYAMLAKLAIIFLTIALAIYIIGFANFENFPALHEGFHDLRHAAGFPCH